MSQNAWEVENLSRALFLSQDWQHMQSGEKKKTGKSITDVSTLSKNDSTLVNYSFKWFLYLHAWKKKKTFKIDYEERKGAVSVWVGTSNALWAPHQTLLIIQQVTSAHLKATLISLDMR